MGLSISEIINMDDDEQYIPQKKLKNHSNPVLYKSMKYIIKQMETSICKIITDNI